MERSYTLENINEVAKECWRVAGNKTVLAFRGEMGSGKTTFIHALCDVKEVKDVVSSPTFSIINEYIYIQDDVAKKIYHIDLYRLKDEEEALQAGIEDCLYSDHICLVEWPEKVASVLPDDTVHIYISAINTRTRRLQLGNN